ncbi:15942_t:CDS:2 [Funneliformis mosseae]|uniref:15942_t:CDS:1 n=1 Tax=Funneliformis mosseae TaxID=27381 RepID=A0A9N9N645_FUNMO|nr:15942_t:CDS:2 [Funneliformis mosseae]
MAFPDITLHTCSTPNGVKISIALEELGLPYKQEKFLLSRIMILNIFESGAILIYLCENYDPEEKLLPKDPKLKSQVIQWIMFQMAGVGPMQGEANFYNTFSPEHYTLADIAIYSMVKFHLICGILNLDDLPNLKAWVARIDARPATQKGIDVPNVD